MAVVYGVLELIVILTAGTFGTINSSPWFNLAIAVVFVLLALAMFDVIEIDFSRFSSRFQVADAKRGTFLLAFTLGALAALLASLRRAGGHPGGALRQRHVFVGHGSRWRCRSCWAWAWRCRGRSPARESRRCRSRVRGW